MVENPSVHPARGESGRPNRVRRRCGRQSRICRRCSTKARNCHQELTHVILRGHHQEGVVEQPIVVGVRGNIRAFIRIGPEVEDLRYPQVGERIGPNEHRSRGSLLHERQLPVIVAQPGQLLVVVDVQKRFPRALIPN